MKRITVGSLMMVLFIGLMVTVSGCAPKQEEVDTAQTVEISLTCIAVLPVVSDPGHDSRLPLNDKKRLEAGVLVLDRLLKQQLSNLGDVHFVVRGQFPGLVHAGEAGFLSMAREVGLQTGCNGVLAVTLYRYRERVGGAYAAEEPASVFFSWRLVEVNSGTVLCYGRYYETQKSLMENLLNFIIAGKRGFAWVTAERLLADGLKEQFARCLYLQESR